MTFFHRDRRRAPERLAPLANGVRHQLLRGTRPVVQLDGRLQQETPARHGRMIVRPRVPALDERADARFAPRLAKRGQNHLVAKPVDRLAEHGELDALARLEVREQSALRHAGPLCQTANRETTQPLDAGEPDGVVDDTRTRRRPFAKGLGWLGAAWSRHVKKIARSCEKWATGGGRRAANPKTRFAGGPSPIARRPLAVARRRSILRPCQRWTGTAAPARSRRATPDSTASSSWASRPRGSTAARSARPAPRYAATGASSRTPPPPSEPAFARACAAVQSSRRASHASTPCLDSCSPPRPESPPARSTDRALTLWRASSESPVGSFAAPYSASSAS